MYSIYWYTSVHFENGGVEFIFEWRREGIYYLYLLFLFCVIVELTTLIFHLWTEIFFHHVDV